MRERAEVVKGVFAQGVFALLSGETTAKQEWQSPAGDSATSFARVFNRAIRLAADAPSQPAAHRDLNY